MPPLHLPLTSLTPDSPDRELLERYAHDRDERAFAALVARHGRMVRAVCRRVLGNDADADDATQATFVVLVRKAGGIRDRHGLANWLYGVAHNVARRAKRTRTRRAAKEATAPRRPEQVASDFADLLHAELAKLPAAYRAAVVLCDLEGRTIAGAAKQLGVPAGTVASRLARGRERLADRLARLGLGVSAGLVAALFAEPAQASAVAFDPSATVPERISTLANEVIRTMFTIPKFTRLGAVLLAAAVALGVAAWGQPPTPPKADVKADAKPDDNAALVADLLKKARKAADGMEGPDQKVYALVVIGLEYARSGDKAEAGRHIKAAVEHLPEKGRAGTAAWVIQTSLKAGLEPPAELLEAAQVNGESGENAMWYFNTGRVKELAALVEKSSGEMKDENRAALAREHLLLGKPDAAAKVIGEIESTSVHMDATRAHLLAQLAYVQHKAKDQKVVSKTVEELDAAAQRVTARDRGRIRDDALAELVGGRAVAGELQAARDLIPTIRDASTRARALAGLARIELDGGDVKAAEKTLEGIPEEYQADRVRWFMVRRDADQKEWKRAEAITDAMTCVYWRVRARYDLAVRYHAAGKAAEAERTVAEATKEQDAVKDREPGYVGLQTLARMERFDTLARLGKLKEAVAEAETLTDPELKVSALLGIVAGLRPREPRLGE